MFAADAGAYLADFGDPVSWSPSAGGAAVTGLMLFDQPAEVIEGGETLSNQYQATFTTASWPGLKRGEVLVVSGTGGGLQYRLRTDPRRQDDGVFSFVSLTKV